MSKEEFTLALKKVYILFPNSFIEPRNDIYYETFQSISNENWLKVVEHLKDSPKFPLIPEIKKIVSDLDLWPKDTQSNGLVVFECENKDCRESITTRKDVLLKAVKEHRGYECPRCKKRYNSQYILDHKLII